MAELFAVRCRVQGGALSGGRSEQKALETKFAQSQKMQAVASWGGVAHDFTTCHRHHRQCESFLMRHQARILVQEITRCTESAARRCLVSQLLAFSRQADHAAQDAGAGDVIGELAQMLRRPGGRRHHPDGGARTRTVAVLPTRAAGHAIINLVVNARDAMPSAAPSPSAPPPDVGKCQRAGTAIIRGRLCPHRGAIPAPACPRRFRARSSIPSSPPSGGQAPAGLATVYGIVKQSGGSSPWTAKWATAPASRSICLAARSKPRTACPWKRRPPRRATLPARTPSFWWKTRKRYAASRASASHAGYNVWEASGGEEALEIVKSGDVKIDLIITDVVMPNMDGPPGAPCQGTEARSGGDFHVGLCEEAFRRNDQNSEDITSCPSLSASSSWPPRSRKCWPAPCRRLTGKLLAKCRFALCSGP